MNRDTRNAVLIFAGAGVALLISYLVFSECWTYHTGLGAGFWAALGACA